MDIVDRSSGGAGGSLVRLAAPLPTVADVEGICTVDDSIVRNLQITQCYYELSAALSGRTGGSSNWCTFATWASRQAGQTIRKEDLQRIFEQRLRTSLDVTFAINGGAAELLRRVSRRRDVATMRAAVEQMLDPGAAFDRASDAVALGNRRVFEEIGRHFARFLSAFPPGAPHDPETIERFCTELRPGDPPDGQGMLQQAFRHYYQALYEPNPAARDELLLLANLEIGMHEQTRLQPEIAGAIEASAVDTEALRRRLIAVLYPGRLGRLRAWLLVLFRRTSPLDALSERLAELQRKQLRLVITEWMMTLDVAGEVLRLGEDLRAEFPEPLRRLTNPELRALLARVDPTPDSVSGTGARDWADLPERMHFIADLFRAYHGRPQLLRAPFTTEQVAELKAGRTPAGRL